MRTARWWPLLAAGAVSLLLACAPPQAAPVPTAGPSPVPTPTPTPMPAPVALRWPTPSPLVTCSVDPVNNRATYQGGAGQVSGFFYRPQATGYEPQPAGPFPAVLVLHTRGGLSSHEQGFALWLASRDDVKAVVSYYGAYHGPPVSQVPTRYPWSDIIAQVKAPVLMLHGERDTTASVSRARTTHRLLLERGKQAELVVYPDAEHQFDQTPSQFFDAQVTADAGARTLAFLAARLK